ncbi:S-adenosyl-L-methionine-dependent methyltransferase [Hymenopellis radicata]|nr:S-adenosyl-L-methionine-dependent methyltransferase [Hymenopellis radicata]
MSSSTAKPDYILPVNETEWKGLILLRVGSSNFNEVVRLDEQSNAMDTLLGNKLGPGDIGQPKKILEVGAGSGAWAIYAANKYPEAEVIAADMNPLPARPLPSNLRYQETNALEPFPFPAGSFDIVHIRLTLCHLQDGPAVLTRLIDLVAPGGWLLADDIDWLADFSGLDNAPGIKGARWPSRGDPHFGKNLKSLLESSSKLTNVHVREVTTPLNSAPADPAEATWAKTFKDTLTRAVAGAPVGEAPAAKAMQKAYLDDAANEGLDWQYSLKFYFGWGKKLA